MEYTYEPRPPLIRKLTVPVFFPYDDQESGFIPATPVFYAERRFGDHGKWVHLEGRRVVRYDIDDRAVAFVSFFCPPKPGG